MRRNRRRMRSQSDEKADGRGSDGMKLSKWCQGCKCASCRWQGTDNCLHDRDKPCRSCNGVKQCVAVYIPVAYGCKGYEKLIISK